MKIKLRALWNSICNKNAQKFNKENGQKLLYMLIEKLAFNWKLKIANKGIERYIYLL